MHHLFEVFLSEAQMPVQYTTAQALLQTIYDIAALQCYCKPLPGCSGSLQCSPYLAAEYGMVYSNILKASTLQLKLLPPVSPIQCFAKLEWLMKESTSAVHVIGLTMLKLCLCCKHLCLHGQNS